MDVPADCRLLCIGAANKWSIRIRNNRSVVYCYLCIYYIYIALIMLSNETCLDIVQLVRVIYTCTLLLSNRPWYSHVYIRMYELHGTLFCYILFRKY